MAEQIVLSKEDDLWNLLEGIVQGGVVVSNDDVRNLVRVVGWRPELLYFPTDPVSHSVSPAIARAVIGYHAALSRAYAALVYQDADQRRLHKDDEEALDLKILVVAGSNGFEVLDGALDRLTHAVLSKITGRQMLLALLVFLLLNFSETVVKDWIHESYAARAREKDQEAHVHEVARLTEEETNRMQLLIAALGQLPRFKPVANAAEQGREPLLRGSLGFERTRVMGNEITNEEARVIVSRDKAEGQGRRLDGRFEVVDINIENPEGWMGIIRDVKSGQEITISINRGELPASDIQTLFEALQNKTDVDAMVNAWFVGDKIQHATIVRADKPKPPSPS